MASGKQPHSSSGTKRLGVGEKAGRRDEGKGVGRLQRDCGATKRALSCLFQTYLLLPAHNTPVSEAKRIRRDINSNAHGTGSAAGGDEQMASHTKREKFFPHPAGFEPARA